MKYLYKLTKRLEISASHCLELDYDSPCENIHGHNWIVWVRVEGSTLDRNDMLIDFKHIKEVVAQLDHQNINSLMKENPTAENIAKWIAEKVQNKIDCFWTGGGAIMPFDERPKVTEVKVQESEGNVACYIP